jgi:hypothetical protein
MVGYGSVEGKAGMCEAYTVFMRLRLFGYFFLSSFRASMIGMLISSVRDALGCISEAVRHPRTTLMHEIIIGHKTAWSGRMQPICSSLAQPQIAPLYLHGLR